MVFKKDITFCEPVQELGCHVTLSVEYDPIRVRSLMLNISANPSIPKGLIQTITAAGWFTRSSLGSQALKQAGV